MAADLKVVPDGYAVTDYCVFIHPDGKVCGHSPESGAHMFDHQYVPPPMEEKPKPTEDRRKPYVIPLSSFFQLCCSTCGVNFGMSREHVKEKVRLHNDASARMFYCPNKHYMVFGPEPKPDCDYPEEHWKRVSCARCGNTWLVTKDFDDRARASETFQFYCPAGDSNVYPKKPKPPEPPGPPKTPADVDYESLVLYHSALSRIALMRPKIFKNREQLRLAINVARNALSLSELKKESK